MSPHLSSAAHRPVLPHSSASYLSKHRRTPSISSPQSQDGSKGAVTFTKGSAQPSMKLLIPVGAESTPPDSVQNSDDEDRGRESGKLAELHEALQHIELKRGHSPERHVDGTASVPTESAKPTAPLRPALTPEARKISHSRSSSEIQLCSHAPALTASPSQTSDDSDDDDDGLTMKPPLLRKKSGELVKPALRPSSRNRRRPSSMPGTPSFSKAVHFNDDIEQVRHFLQVDRPIAVSAGSSPVETYDSESEYPFGYDDGNGYANSRRARIEWELRQSNFPRETFERKTLPVRVEKIALSPDSSTLVGTVAVANLAFNKSVVARFTLDYWKTTSEVTAEYSDDVRRKQAHDGCDRFVFNIKLADLANLESKTMLLCVRYSVNGTEYWDNNNSMNFQVDFIKKVQPKPSTRVKQGSAGTRGAIPRSRRSPPSGRPRNMPASIDDDFNNNNFESKYTFGSRNGSSNDSLQPAIKLKNKSKPQRVNLFPDQPTQNTSPSTQAFSTRYDFSASLSAALSTAQTALGDHSGLRRSNKPRSADYFSLQGEAPATTTSAAPRPDQLSSEKPDLKSAEYNELIQKYCFVRPPAPPQAGHLNHGH